MADLHDEAIATLRALVGDDAEFRPGQWEAMAALVGDRKRVLVVQRTGWGKSAVYFVATKLLRSRGGGPTLLVSPLLGLMRNQIQLAERGGVRAVRIASDNSSEWEDVIDRLDSDEVDLLLISPERFANPRFRSDVLPTIASRVGLFVIDEAHCISDWGHDFRPDYRRLTRVLDLLPRGVPVLCTTATANDRVVADIVEQLGDDLLVLRGDLDRESLILDVLELPSAAQRLAWLAVNLPRLPGTGIVYTLTVEDARRVTAFLRERSIDARAYFGDEANETKQEIERMLEANEIKCVVATSALGMGYDKPDLAFVVHYQIPGSAIAYYQQVGRAGRAIETAYGVALAGSEDRQIQDWFIKTAFPPRDNAEQVVALLAERADWVRLTEIEAEINVRHSRLETMLRMLEVDGVVEREGRKYRRTLTPWEYPQERVEAVTERRREEQSRMRDFVSSASCLMEFLRRELDDPHASPCGRCAVCRRDHVVEPGVERDALQNAMAFLRHRWLEIEPRKRWPDGTNVPREIRAETGRVLSVYGDGGWGSDVKREKGEGRYDDALVTALKEVVSGWAPVPAPSWVTCVPSLRHAELVSSFAQRLAARLDVPFHAIVRKVHETAPQKDMDNSAQQYRNIAAAFDVGGAVPEGPVLLVDDIVDSRWTLTVIAALLRQNGSGPVFPLALAQAQSD